ncbi:MAG: prepilin-type N-terminal cleavage/methylation domain-containing protein, partial [Candidatus Saccharibacteria bacterium]
MNNRIKFPSNNRLSGFTIVEIIVVIVIIGILTAITMVTYSSFAERSIITSLESDLTKASLKLKNFQSNKAAFPTAINDCPITDSNKTCIKSSPGNTFSYEYDNNSVPQTFFLKASNGNFVYYITSVNGSLPKVFVATMLVTVGSISETTAVGSTLTAGTISPSSATVSYQWQSATTSGGAYTNISGATSSTYVLTSNELGKYIKLTVTGTGIYSGTLTSTASAVVVAATTPITAIAAISGTTSVGQVLTAGARTPSAATVSYQWQSAATSGGTYTNISGATSSTYTLTSSELTKFIKVTVTGSGSYSGTVTSDASSVVTSTVQITVAAWDGGGGAGGGSGNVGGSGGGGAYASSLLNISTPISYSVIVGNAGFGAAIARGVEQLPSMIEGVQEWLWILHDDCLLHPGALEALLASIEERPNVAMAGPKLLGWHDKTHLLEAGIS